MLEQQLCDLVELAIRQTERRKLHWEAIDDETFRAVIGIGALRIHANVEQIGDVTHEFLSSPYYELWVMNLKGQVVESVRAREGANQYDILDKLFVTARKAALDGHIIIDQMMAALYASG